MERPKGLYATWRAVMFAPRAFFSIEAEPPSETGPVAFAALLSLIVSPIAAITGGLVGGVELGALVGPALAYAIIGPIGTVISVYVVAALTHLVLKLVGAAKKPFATTLGCIAYAYAPAALAIVPVLGGIVGGIWQLALIGIGVRRRQGGHALLGIFAALAVPLLAIALALALRVGVVEAFKLPSGSMSPTLVVGDHVFVNKLAYAKLLGGSAPERGDVIVFRFPDNREQDFVKRVVAIGGDKLEVVDGRPIINGVLTPECFVGDYQQPDGLPALYVEFLGGHPYLTLHAHKHDEPSCTSSESCSAGSACVAGICGVRQGPWTIAANEVFVMGDNRNNSHDSRQWRGGLGAGVPVSDIKGRVSMVWMSFKVGGGIARERIGLGMKDPPRAPLDAPPAIADAIAACLAKGPTKP